LIVVFNETKNYEYLSKKYFYKKIVAAKLFIDKNYAENTLTAPDQNDLEITLMEISEGRKYSKESSKQLRQLIKDGTFRFGVFKTNDINATYEELKEKGVEFTPPQSKNSMPPKQYLKMIQVIGFH